MQLAMLFEILFMVLGGLGIFLLGMKHMSEGMQAVAGARLRKVIGSITDNRLMAVAVGAFITCVVQSSSVTTVMVVGLVNGGFMTLMQSIGVIIGANVGTTITGWILTLKIGAYGLPLLGAAALVFLFSRTDRVRYIGMALMGVGMVFFGLELMSNGFKPLRSMPEFSRWFHLFQADSYLGVLKCALVGCVLTLIVQSSSATLGITMGLAMTGVIRFETAAALVLGENIGTTITAYLASLGGSTNAKRAAYAHITFNVLGVAWITALFPFYIALVKRLLPIDPATAVLSGELETFPHTLAGIALVHSGFNIANTLLFLPFMRPLANMVTRLAPDRGVKETTHLRFLDVRMLDTPALGITQSRKELIFMGESDLLMLERLRDLVASGKAEPVIEGKIFHRESILDNVQKEVTVFLTRMTAARVPAEVTTEVHSQLRMADEFESISDYVVDLLKMLLKLRKNNLQLSEEGKSELLDLHDLVAGHLKLVVEAVRLNRPAALTEAYAVGKHINSAMKASRRRHLARLTERQLDPLMSLVFSDMLNAYRRIKDHAINIAEAVGGEK